MKTELVKVNQEAIKVQLQEFIDSGNLPVHVKSVEQAFLIVQMGHELGFGTIQSMHYIMPIQGRLSLSAKAIGALLRKGGVRFVTKEDGVYVFADESTGSYPTKPDGSKAIDQRTTIQFIRDGLTEDVSFTWTDAAAQGLTTKDNWKRMKREMLYARTLAKGANRIGQDLLLGLYMTEELTDAFDVKESSIKRNEDGTISEIIEDTTYTEA